MFPEALFPTWNPLLKARGGESDKAGKLSTAVCSGSADPCLALGIACAVVGEKMKVNYSFVIKGTL